MADPATGTQKKQGDARGPVPGHETLGPADVAPRRGRASALLIGLAALIALILIVAIVFANGDTDAAGIGPTLPFYDAALPGAAART